MDPMTALHSYIDGFRSMNVTFGRLLPGRLDAKDAIESWFHVMRTLPADGAKVHADPELRHALELFGRVAAHCRAALHEWERGERGDAELVSRMRELLDDNEDMNEAWSEAHELFPDGLPLTPVLPGVLSPRSRQLVAAATEELNATGSKAAVIDVPASNLVVAVGRPDELIRLLQSRIGS
jgi:hypothetical protein